MKFLYLMTVNLSALWSCLTKKKALCKRRLCAGRGQGQGEAFDNFVLLIKAHWKKTTTN